MIKKITISIAGVLMTLLLSAYVFPFCKKQGIQGRIYRVKGNHMPSPDDKPAPLPPFQTTLYIYELTNMSQVQQSGTSSFYTSIGSKLVKKVASDKNGSFKVKLPPGEYSLFIKKDSLFYANIFDGQNNIAPVQVKKGEFTSVDVKADYDAYY